MWKYEIETVNENNEITPSIEKKSYYLFIHDRLKKIISMNPICTFRIRKKTRDENRLSLIDNN